MARKSRAKPASPFRRFSSSPEVIRLVVLMYVRFPLSLRSADVIHASCWWQEASMDGANAFTGPSGQGHRGDRWWVELPRGGRSLWRQRIECDPLAATCPSVWPGRREPSLNHNLKSVLLVLTADTAFGLKRFIIRKKSSIS